MVDGHLQYRRAVLRLVVATILSSILAVPLPARAQSEPLSAVVRIYETTTSHSSFPDECDGRLDRLYIAEDLEMGIAVQFNRPPTEDEAPRLTWEVSNGAAEPGAGDFVGQPNPALITTTMVGVARRDA